MLKIKNGTDISYTQGDTFTMNVRSKNSFTEGSKLTLVVSKNEETTPIISNDYSLLGEVFVVTLTSVDRKRLVKGEYIYKLILTDTSGNIITQKSGFFTVKWGA